VRIAVADPAEPEIVALLEEHLRDMRATSPPESVHALDLDGLCDPAVTVWSVRDDAGLVAIGALKDLGDGHGEIKSMRVAGAFRGRGIASLLLRHLLAAARDRGLTRVSLETGTQPFFAPARTLYTRHGFGPCRPFGTYTDDPNSAYFTLRLDGHLDTTVVRSSS
jgi:putative acetyltransferase